MEEALLDNLKKLQEKCEERHINYGLFICDKPHSVTGAANFTLEEISIVIENIARSLPLKHIQFIQHILSLVAKEKQHETNKEKVN